MRRPAQSAVHNSASPLNLGGQDSPVSNGGDVVIRAANTASVRLESGTSASFHSQGTVLGGDLVLGTGSESVMTLGGAPSTGSAGDLRLLGQATAFEDGGSLVLLAGRSAAQAQAGGSVLIDAGTDPASDPPAEVQLATVSVSLVCLSVCLSACLPACLFSFYCLRSAIHACVHHLSTLLVRYGLTRWLLGAGPPCGGRRRGPYKCSWWRS